MNKLIGIGILTAVTGSTAGCGGSPPDQADPAEDVGTAASEFTYVGSSAVYDYGTQCVAQGISLHCCPSGKAMIGMRLDMNVFKCAKPTPPANGTVNGLVGNPHLVFDFFCPFGQVEVGYNQSFNAVLCDTPTQAVTHEVVDTGTQDGFAMHVCRDKNGSSGTIGTGKRFMVGMDSLGQFLCAGNNF